jgi:hypothetical protein
MTGHKYKEGLSKRILVAKEALSKTRMTLPVLILDLDGVVGYFDQAKTYLLRQSDLTQIISLSNNFRMVAFSCS